MPELGGFFTITVSENLTNCWSHHQGGKCPRCKHRRPAEVVAEVSGFLHADAIDVEECAMYSRLRSELFFQIRMQPDKGDGEIDPLTALDWIGERFNNAPAPNDCASFSAAYESSGEIAGAR